MHWFAASVSAWWSGKPQPISTRSTCGGSDSSRSGENSTSSAPEGLERLERVGEIAAERLVERVGHAEPRLRLAARPAPADLGHRPAPRQLVDRVEVGELQEALGQRRDQVLGRGLPRLDLGQGPADLRQRLHGAHDRPPHHHADEVPEPLVVGGVGQVVEQDRVDARRAGSAGGSRRRLGAGTMAIVGRSSASAIGPSRPGRQSCGGPGRRRGGSSVPSTTDRSAPHEPRAKTARQTSGGISHASRCRPGSPVAWRTTSVAVRHARARKCWTTARRVVRPASSASPATDGSGPVAATANPSRG